MIYGIGTDICDIRRIQASLAQHGTRFAAKILAPAEWTAWQERHSRCPDEKTRVALMLQSCLEYVIACSPCVPLNHAPKISNIIQDLHVMNNQQNCRNSNVYNLFITLFNGV